MAATAFDDIALVGESTFEDARVAPVAATIHRRVRRQRAARATMTGAVAVATCGALAFGMTSTNEDANPAVTAGPVLDPATIATTSGVSGANLAGACPGETFSAGRPTAELKRNQFSILTGISDCDLSSVRGEALISASTTLREQTIEDHTVLWLRTTITNTSGQTLAFDLASPTLEVTVPEDYDWYYEIMSAERPLHADESWDNLHGVEGWGGSSSPRGGIGQTITPVLDGPPAPGTVWNLVVQRPHDHGFSVSTSRGTVTLAPNASFVFESSLSPVDEMPTASVSKALVALFEDPRRVSAAAYVALQADTVGGAPRTLLVDAAVPLSWNN